VRPESPARHPRWGGSVEALGRRFPFLVNSGYATITAGSAGLLLVLLTIAGRFLSVDDYGRFNYAIALTTIVETVMDIGLAPVTVRAVARDKAGADRLFRHVLGLKVVWIAIGLALLALVAPILRPDPQVIRLCYLMGLSSAVRSYLLTARGLLQGLDRFDLEAVVVVADRLLLLAAGGAVLWAGYGLLGLAMAFVGARVAMLFAVMLLLGRIVGPAVPQFDRAAWRDLQTAALPIGFFMIALNLYTYIDTVILGVISTNAETGRYGASYRVYEGLMYVPAILSAVLSPRLSYLFVHDRPAHRQLLMRALLGSMILGIVLGAIAVWAARPILLTLFGADYAPAVRPLQILAAGALFVFGTWILHAAAISMNLDRRLLLTTVVGLSANVILNLMFIPRWGISGAAGATVIAEAITVALLWIQVRRRLRRA
jgi:O-antigen/teichoic acid export membrane protein